MHLHKQGYVNCLPRFIKSLNYFLLSIDSGLLRIAVRVEYKPTSDAGNLSVPVSPGDTTSNENDKKYSKYIVVFPLSFFLAIYTKCEFHGL